MAEPARDEAAELRAAVARLEAALGAARDAVVWTGPDGVIEWCNRGFDRLVERRHQKVIGRRLHELLRLEKDGRPVAPQEHPGPGTILNGNNGNRHSSCFEMRRDGRLLTLEIQGERLPADSGPSPAFVFTIRDISVRTRAEEALEFQAALEDEGPAHDGAGGKPAPAAASTPLPVRPWPRWAVILALAAAYLATGKLGLLAAFLQPNATPVWAPTGIALAAVLVWGSWVWPGIFAGAFLVNALTAGSPWTSLGIAAGNTIEALLGGALVNRFAYGRFAFEKARDVFRFAFLAAAASTAASATIGVTSLALGGFAPWVGYGGIWLTWWLGDAVGAMVVAPFAILWLTLPAPRWTRAQVLEAAATLAALVVVCQAVFGGLLAPALNNAPVEFLCVPILMWTAFRFGQRETATALLILSALAVLGTLRGYGPFVRRSPNDSLLLLQGFMGATAATFLAISAVVSQQRRAESALWSARADLEHRVRQRTQALSGANDALRADIGERRRMERELTLKTEELARSNTELSLFASVASHELQEPLRKMLSFTGLLTADESVSDQDKADYLRCIQGAAWRMQRLVEDILDLSRVTVNAKPLERVNLAETAREVAADFAERVRRDGGSIELGDLPVVRADGAQMRQLLSNLISNAHKFRRKDVPLKISIGLAGASRDGFVEFVVRDNGIGFEEQFGERIFKPFARLHPRGAYEGSGMGLAICQRILMRHGGEITAKSGPGRGAEFTVVLPDPGGAPHGQPAA